jgi:hypothetical protein
MPIRLRPILDRIAFVDAKLEEVNGLAAADNLVLNESEVLLAAFVLFAPGQLLREGLELEKQIEVIEGPRIPQRDVHEEFLDHSDHFCHDFVPSQVSVSSELSRDLLYEPEA